MNNEYYFKEERKEGNQLIRVYEKLEKNVEFPTDWEEVNKEFSSYGGQLCLFGTDLAYFDGIDYCEHGSYYVIRRMNSSENELISSFEYIIPLKGRITNAEYEILMYRFKIN